MPDSSPLWVGLALKNKENSGKFGWGDAQNLLGSESGAGGFIIKPFNPGVAVRRRDRTPPLDVRTGFQIILGGAEIRSTWTRNLPHVRFAWFQRRRVPRAGVSWRLLIRCDLLTSAALDAALIRAGLGVFQDKDLRDVGDWRKNIEDKSGMDGRKKMFEAEA